MKRLLAIIMSMVFVLVAGVSCFNPNKETEAEYKTRIKKELDAIPVEATGYKLVDPTKNDVVYPEGEEPQKGSKMEIDGHVYEFYYGVGYSIYYTLDKKEDITLISSENDFFSKYQTQFAVYYYDNHVFIVRYLIDSSAYSLDYSGFLPPLLFICDLENNTAKYMGYLEEWFDYSLATIWSQRLDDKICAIVKN